MWILIYYIVTMSGNMPSGGVAAGQVEFSNQQKCEMAAASLQLNKEFGTHMKVMCVAK